MAFGSELNDRGKEEAAVGRSLLQTSRDGGRTEEEEEGTREEEDGWDGVLGVTSDLHVLLPVRRNCGCFYCLCSATPPQIGSQQPEGKKKPAVQLSS